MALIKAYWHCGRTCDAVRPGVPQTKTEHTVRSCEVTVGQDDYVL